MALLRCGSNKKGLRSQKYKNHAVGMHQRPLMLEKHYNMGGGTITNMSIMIGLRVMASSVYAAFILVSFVGSNIQQAIIRTRDGRQESIELGRDGVLHG